IRIVGIAFGEQPRGGGVRRENLDYRFVINTAVEPVDEQLDAVGYSQEIAVTHDAISSFVTPGVVIGDLARCVVRLARMRRSRRPSGRVSPSSGIPSPARSASNVDAG